MSENIDDATQLSDTTRLSDSTHLSDATHLASAPHTGTTPSTESAPQSVALPNLPQRPVNHSRSVSRAKPRKQPHRHCPPASIPDYCPSPRLRSGISSSPSMRWSKMSPRWLSARPSLSSNASPH